jgi:hypothetical protein
MRLVGDGDGSRRGGKELALLVATLRIDKRALLHEWDRRVFGLSGQKRGLSRFRWGQTSQE